jgi:hypothetical protein
MSNTPRTDAATVRMERLDGDIDEVVSADFARQLERELIAAQKTINQIKLEWEPAPSATAATDAEVDEFVRVARTFSDEHFQNSLVAELRRVYHALALQDAAPVEVAEPDRPDWARQLPGAEIFDRDHGYDRTASINAGRYVCTCGACSHYDAGGLPMSEKMEWDGKSLWAKIDPSSSIFFNCGAAKALLVLDKDGLIYKGQRIEDAGEAHRAWLEVMVMLKNPHPVR